MSKIVYPENETLSGIVRNSLYDTLQDLNSAQNYCIFAVPGDFQYLGYLKELGNNILNFRQEIVNISSMIEQIDQSYSSTLDGLDTYRQSLDLSVLEERNRLVK